VCGSDYAVKKKLMTGGGFVPTSFVRKSSSWFFLELRLNYLVLCCSKGPCA